MVESEPVNSPDVRLLMIPLKDRSKPATETHMQGRCARAPCELGGRPVPLVEFNRGRLNSEISQKPRQGVQPPEESGGTSLRREG